MAKWLGRTKTPTSGSGSSSGSLTELRQQAANKSTRRLRLQQTQQTQQTQSIARTTPSLPASSRLSSFGSGWGSSRRVRLDATLFRNGGDVALAGIIFLAPLVLGGRHPIGRLVYILLVTLLMGCWVGERFCNRELRWKSSGVEWLLLAGAAILVVQSLELPADLLARISPAQSELIPTWGTELATRLRLHSWSHLSFTPHATWLALGVFLAHAALFTVMVQRFQDSERISRVIQWIGLAVVGMATLGLLQFLSGTDKFVWIFDHPSRPADIEVTAAFANSNHFTHFLALGIGPLIWWLSRFKPRKAVTAGPTGNRFGGQESIHDWSNTAMIFALALVGIAGLLAKSRGGIIVMFLATAISVGLLIRTQLLSSKSWLALSGIGILVIAGLTFYGYNDVKHELATLTSGSINEIDDSGARQKIWAANWELIRRFPILGTGVGSHAEVYHRFFPHQSAVEFTHAESGVIQLITETGWVGGFLLLFGWITCGRWTLGALRNKDPQLLGCAIAIASGLAVSAVHSIFDFPWYLTSCMSFAIIMAAAACCLSQKQTESAESDLRAAKKPLPFSDAQTSPPDKKSQGGLHWPLGGLVWLVLLVSFSLAHLGPAMGAPHWDRYLKLSLNSKRSLHHQLLSNLNPKQRNERIAAQRHENTRLMAYHLQQCLNHDPNHPRANARMTASCLQLFEDAQKDSQNAMALDQIRDAVIASKFADKEKLNAWLDVAIGDPRALLDKALYHCLEGHRTTPVDGRGYIYLSRLAFLQGVENPGVRELLDAAEHVRPNDAFVLYQKGRESAMRGDIESTLVFWRQSFAMSHTYRDEIIAGLAPHIPAPLFIDSFQPDAEGLTQLFSFYRRNKLTMQASIAGPLVVKNIIADSANESGVPAGKMWHRCRSIYRYLGQSEEALRCARQAVIVAPNWFDARLTLADEFMAQEHYAQAIQEYQWCQQRKPLDAMIRQRLNVAQTLVAKQDFQRTAGSPMTAPKTNNNATHPLLEIPQISLQPDGGESPQRY